MAVNTWTGCGNLTRDPELRVTGTGQPVLQIGIAINERKRIGESEYEDYANYFDCLMFGTRAEKLANILKKGMKVSIVGRLHQDRWEDKDTGRNKSAVKIYIGDIELMQKNSSAEQVAAAGGVYGADIPF